MERRSRLLIEVVTLMLFVSLTLTFYRSIILKDFYIITIEGEGDETPAE